MEIMKGSEVDELKSLVQSLQSDVKDLRVKNEHLIEENKEFAERLSHLESQLVVQDDESEDTKVSYFSSKLFED